jgi:hypothetical protein
MRTLGRRSRQVMASGSAWFPGRCQSRTSPLSSSSSRGNDSRSPLRNAHPNPEQYQSQRILVVEVNQYVYLVPYVEDDDYLFLKTIIPSRKATRDYLRQDTT